MKNREPMSDAQRRAMFARLRRGGARAEVPSSGNSADGNSQSLEKTGLLSGAELAALPPWDPRYQDAGGVSGAESDFTSLLPFTRGAQTIAGNIYKGLGSAGKILASWKTPVVSALSSMGIGKYRDANPTMDPRKEKVLAIAQQLASYAAAMTGLGAAKGTVGALAPSQVSKVSQQLAKLGEKLSAAGSYVADKIPAAVKKPLAKLHSGYTKVSDITGASWADLKNVPNIGANLKKAGSLREAAAAARQQADEIVSAANELKIVEQNKATDILHASHKGSLADWESAQRMYGEGASKWYAAEYGQAASMKTARLMREQAAKMEEQAAQMTKDAQMSAIKGALVVAGFTTKEITEEARIRDYQNQMEAAFAHGDSFTLPPEQPRGALGTAAAFVTGTLGNPIEKQTRYGADAYAAQVANYRAKYDAIGRAEQSGEISPAEADAQRQDLAANDKPWNMAGKGPWTFAPAAAAYLSWQAQNIADTLNRTSIDTVKPGAYMDGDTVNLTEHSGANSIRLLDINAPEVAHDNSNDPNHPERKTGELFGQAAAAYARSLLPDGQTVRVVLDSHNKAAGKEVHGRQLASLETLPAPFDKLLAIPGIGKLIPAKEFQTEMIKAGLADIHYRELSGPTDMQKQHDIARAIAQSAGKNIWSQEGRDALPWVGQTKTQADVIAEKNAKRATAAENAGLPPPPVPPTEDPSGIGNIFGAGLMVAGNTGTFKPMGDAGTAIAQAWNAALAGFGVREYNLKALEHPDPIVYRPPKGLRTQYEKHAEIIIKKRRTNRQPPPNKQASES